MKLNAYNRKTGKFVDSITNPSKEGEQYFRQDFADCKIVKWG